MKKVSHVGLITYQIGHLKTLQLARKLLTKGIKVSIFAFPFKIKLENNKNENIRYKDRPSQIIDLNIEEFCNATGIAYYKVDGWLDQYSKELDGANINSIPEIYLHCIAKIIPKSFIAGRTILNCHPGLLPQNRGVDAFKWSIVNKWPIGITLHKIDEEIDRGNILHRIRIPILPDDVLEDVWKRAYDFENDLLSNFEYYLLNDDKNWFVGDDFPCSHVYIDKELDNDIENIFLRNKFDLIELSRNYQYHSHKSDFKD